MSHGTSREKQEKASIDEYTDDDNEFTSLIVRELYFRKRRSAKSFQSRNLSVMGRNLWVMSFVYAYIIDV